MCRTSIGINPSTAFRSTFVTTRTPLVGAERGELTIISEKQKEKYFWRRHWTIQIGLNARQRIDLPVGHAMAVYNQMERH